MFAVYLAAGSPVLTYLGLALALVVVATLGGWTAPRNGRWLVGLAVAVVGGLLLVGTAEAVLILCPAEWKWLGICR